MPTPPGAPARRVLRNNRRGQSGLWSYGISGDVPIVLLRISDATKIEIVRQLVQAHSYWRMKGLTVDLVILNEDVSVYRQPLHDQITGLIAAGIEAQLLDKPGGIFVRRLEQIPSEDRVLLQSVARIVIDDENGTLAEQLELRRGAGTDHSRPAAAPVPRSRDAPRAAGRRAELIFHNGLGGFTRDGREYVITLQAGPDDARALGQRAGQSDISARSFPRAAAAYTWVRELPRIPADALEQRSGAATPAARLFIIRDEQTGQFWSPTPLPARGATPYVIRHGFGYTVFEHTENGIASELWIYVAMDAPVKFAVLKLRNVSGRRAGCPSPAIGNGCWAICGTKSLLHVQTEMDLNTGALLARNPYNTEFAERIAFVDVERPARTSPATARSFSAATARLAQPAALRRDAAFRQSRRGAGSVRRGAGGLRSGRGQEREIEFSPGRGPQRWRMCRTSIRRFRAGRRRPRGARRSLATIGTARSGAVQVETPDPAVNVLANGWLLYQTLELPPLGPHRILSIRRRVWLPRSIAGCHGAGARRAGTHARASVARRRAPIPRRRRAALVASAGGPRRAHAFLRRLSLAAVCDLPLCRVRRRHRRAGRERFRSSKAGPVKPEEEAYYDLPHRSEESATLYEHCVRAIEHGLKFGEHGLPLMGCGDWNDGMNLVGKRRQGRKRLAGVFPLRCADAIRRAGARTRATRLSPTAASRRRAQLRQNIEQHAWDGDWYRRAYFDNGEPLGSADQSGMPDRFPAAKLVGDSAARAIRQRVTPGDGSRRPAAGPARGRADPAVRSAVRQVRR